jgi:D-glycero-alpha-D-manno-heptose 1-phosphate guanylyltransferase
MPNAPDAIVLCGGAGTRLRSVTGEAPKSLATIGDRPFLELLLHQLRRHGFQRAILAVGYQRDLIRSHLGDRACGVTLEYSIESTPLGTGGALRNAIDLVSSDSVLIMNGDSYTDADLSAFAAEFHAARADMSVVVVPADGRADCGLVSVDSRNRVLGFKEKQTSTGNFHVNAGIYMATKRIFQDVTPAVRMSLEEELFPRWLAEGKYLRAFSHPGKCVDIGTPERYQTAQDILANVEIGQAISNPSGTIRA